MGELRSRTMKGWQDIVNNPLVAKFDSRVVYELDYPIYNCWEKHEINY